jgi:hypothetical protein
MSRAKSVPKGLTLLVCERGIGGENLIILYIPKKDPVQEALKKNKKDQLLQVDATSHWQRAESHTLGVRDSRAVHTACALNEQWSQ